MKKVSAFVLVAFLLYACTPSEQAIQEAIAETQTAVPTPVVEQVTAAPLQPTESLPTNTATTIPSTIAKSCSDVKGSELLSEPWRLEGDNSGEEQYQEVEPNILQGNDTLLITYDLHGLTIHEGDRKDESAIIFDQPHWFVISLANYGQNGLDGQQTVFVPLSDFIGLPDEPSGTPGGTLLNLDQPVDMLHARFWSGSHFVIDITSICVFKS